MSNNIIEFKDFLKVDIRVGTVITAKLSEGLKKPYIILQIDFGKNIGIKKSSAQLTANYVPKKLVNKQVAAVVNFKPKQIGNLISEVLVLGFPDLDKEPILFSPDKKIENGSKIF
ncbi:MAG: putative chaperone CsaA [Alphaproteobacteria bacterium MarineAlpha5_Bin9]|nr:MAG: putative chaperone CsaA [Alphaproteobacteria bacterium MarineAlpha5_Bin9]|tara:strand:- start:1834 stop:2178 length:345 start_codon:yes stop_codon:yes gene_type:complete